MLNESLSNVRVLTHSAIRLQADNGTVIYSDPYHLTEEFRDADIVLITHEHFDHLSPEDYVRVAKTDTVVVAPASLAQGVAQLQAAQTVLLQAGETAEVRGITIAAVPAYNVMPERLKMHPQSNGWVGYVLTIDGATYYIAGDTDHNPDNETVRCDVALIPIGGTYTMNPQQAATFINTIKPQYVVPTHYGTVVGNKTDGETFAALVEPPTKVVLKMEWK